MKNSKTECMENSRQKHIKHMRFQTEKAFMLMRPAAWKVVVGSQNPVPKP